MTENKKEAFDQALRQTIEGRLTRRDFVVRAAALGLSIPAAGAILAACQAAATMVPAATSTAAAGASAAAIATPAPLPSNAAQGLAIMVAPPVTNNKWWDGWVAAANKAAADLGMTTNIQNFNGSTDAQVSAFSNAKNLGVAGAMTMANVAAVSPKLMQSCQDQKVFCANNHSEQPWVTPLDIGDYFVLHLEFPHQGSMESLATFLFEKMGKKGNILHITGVPGNNASDLKDYGLDQVLKKYPDIHMLARQPGYFGRVKTIPVVENLLTTYPDVKAIIAQNDDQALGAITVLKQKGLMDKILVVGFDAIPESLDAIDAGELLATVVNPGEWMGGYMMVRIFDAINGVKYDDLDRMQMFETFVLNSKPAADAYRKIQQAGFPYDWQKMSRFLHPNDWDVQIGLRDLNPESFWLAFESTKPAVYKLPAAYQVPQANYDARNADYAAHLKYNQLDAVKALVDPLYVAPPNDYWTRMP